VVPAGSETRADRRVTFFPPLVLPCCGSSHPPGQTCPAAACRRTPCDLRSSVCTPPGWLAPECRSQRHGQEENPPIEAASASLPPPTTATTANRHNTRESPSAHEFDSVDFQSVDIGFVQWLRNCVTSQFGRIQPRAWPVSNNSRRSSASFFFVAVTKPFQVLSAGLRPRRNDDEGLLRRVL